MPRKPKVALGDEAPTRGRPRKPDGEVSARTLRRRGILPPQLVQKQKEKKERRQKKEAATGKPQTSRRERTIQKERDKPVPDRIRLLIGSGMTTSEVSRVLGISLDALTQKYGEVIDNARVDMKAEALELMWDLARAGSSPMVRRVIELTSVPQTREAFTGGKKTEEKKVAAPKIGKKEQQAIAAANPDLEDPMGALMAQRASRSRMN